MRKKTSTRIITPTTIQDIIERESINQVMDMLIERLQKAIYEYDSSTTKIPVRSGFSYSKPQPGLVEWMPIYQKNNDVLLKLVGYHPKNPISFQIPTIASTISSYNVATGQLVGLMDGVLPTAMRTGAASAIASNYLAHPNSETIGLIGCGAQSITQLHALSRVFNFKKVLLFDKDQQAMDSFSTRIEPLDLTIEIEKSSIRDIVQHSDIVCTATSIDIGEGPLFENVTTKPHIHINAVGSDFPGKVELPIGLLRDAFICPDFLEQALQEGESQQLLKGHIGPELHQVIKHSKNYEEQKEKVTVFDSTGWALEDRVVFHLFMDLAIKYNVGEEMQIEYMPEDAINPYEFLQVKVESHL